MQAPRDGQDQRHRDVGRIIGENAWRIGNGDAALRGGLNIDIVHAGPELRDHLQLLARF